MVASQGPAPLSSTAPRALTVLAIVAGPHLQVAAYELVSRDNGDPVVVSSHVFGSANLTSLNRKDYELWQGSKLGNSTTAGLGNNLHAVDGNHERELRGHLMRLEKFVRSTVLCVGAQLGGETRTFQALTHVELATGLDLAPGDKNPHVVYGDAMRLAQFKDGSFGTLYSNVLDHIPDIASFARAAHRVLKPDGTLLIDILNQSLAEDAWAVRDLAADREKIEGELLNNFSLVWSRVDIVGRTHRRGLYRCVFAKRGSVVDGREGMSESESGNGNHAHDKLIHGRNLQMLSKSPASRAERFSGMVLSTRTPASTAGVPSNTSRPSLPSFYIHSAYKDVGAAKMPASWASQLSECPRDSVSHGCSLIPDPFNASTARDVYHFGPQLIKLLMGKQASLQTRLDEFGRVRAVELFSRLRRRGMKSSAVGLDFTALACGNGAMQDALQDQDVEQALELTVHRAAYQEAACRRLWELDMAAKVHACAPSAHMKLQSQTMKAHLHQNGYVLIDDWGLDVAQLQRQADAELSRHGNKSFTSTSSLPEIERLLHNPALAQVIRDYLGGPVRFDGYHLYSTVSIDQDNPSALWHHDRCGRRLKLFVFVSDVNEHNFPTHVAPGTHNNVYHLFDADALASRFADAYVRSNYPIDVLTGRAGGGFIFDTNMIHQIYRHGVEKRTVVRMEFHAHNKYRALAGTRTRHWAKAPCPSSPRHYAAHRDGLPGYPEYPQESGR